MKLQTLLLPVAVVLVNGCTAIHPINITSIPAGASVELNGEFIGTTPFTYEFESNLAQEIWPEDVQFRARLPLAGYTAEQKAFERHSKLQQSIQFILYDKSPDQVTTTRTQSAEPTKNEQTISAPLTPGKSENEREWEEYQNLFDEDSVTDE